MSLPRYPTYMDSGVEWLGEVPEHWSLSKVKHAFEFRSGGTPSKTNLAYWDGDVPWASSKDLKQDSLADTTDHITELAVADGAALVEPGTLLVVVRGMILAHTFPVTKALVAMAINQDLKGLTARDGWNVDYAAQVLRASAPETFRRLDEAGHGTKALRMDAWGGLEVPRPPAEEQTLIAAFLDRETAKIDALVAEQQRLIELLKEKRQAVTSHAVTKGLNPNAPMKDSGIEWLGEVPEHWSSIQVGKTCTKVADGPHYSPDYVDEGVLFLSARNIKVDGWALDDVKYVSDSDCAVFDRRIAPQPGDVLYTKGGTTGIARVVDLDVRFQIWVHVAVLRIRPDVVDAHYLAFALNSIGCYEQSQLLTRGATNNDLGLTRMIKIWLALPPLGEQRRIVDALRIKTNALSALTIEAERAIDLLQERRTALISAAVTGQIDVRRGAERARS